MGWGVISMRSSEQVQVSVLVMLLTISHSTQRSGEELVGEVYWELVRQGSGDRMWLLH